MNSSLLRGGLVAFFAITIGSFAFGVWAPLQMSEYFIGGDLTPYVVPEGAEGSGTTLYLRRTFSVTRKPLHAWIQVVGHDGIIVYVNGRMQQNVRVVHPYGSNAALLDITPALNFGTNSIAVMASQRALRRAPAVAIDGALIVSNDVPRSLANGWRFGEHFERHDKYWYDTEFDDSHWRPAELGARRFMRGQLVVPPRSVKKAPTARWISAASCVDGKSALRREFQVAGRPQHGWLRVTASAPYAIAVNEQIVHQDHEELATPSPYRSHFRTFDVSRYLRGGRNVVSIALSSRGENPYLAAECEVENKAGEFTYFESDESWAGKPDAPPDWHLINAGAGWTPALQETGQLNKKEMLRDRFYPRRQIEGSWLDRQAIFLYGFVGWTALVAWLGCRFMNFAALALKSRVPSGAAYVFLLLPSVVCAFLMLAMHDSSIAQLDFYQPGWLTALVVLLLLQWFTIIAVSVVSKAQEWPQLDPEPRTARTRLREQFVAAAILTVVVAAGLWLRSKDLLAEPLHHDEVGAYYFSQSVFKLGFPGGQAHPDMPFGYCATSELVYFFNAPFTLLFDDPRLVIRIPTILWSIYTLVLLYHAGKRMFNAPAGLIAAGLYSFSPYLIGMANFGRYFSQVQFFALLTCYAFYETIRGRGPINRRWLWITAISFSAMYLSWEGSGFMAIGMMVAALLHRRGNLKTIFQCPSIYASLIVVGSVFLAQNSHRTFQQVHRLWYGTGISDVTIAPMWRYPKFDLIFYLREASWTADSLLPLLGLAGAIILALRHPRKDAIRIFLVIFLVTGLAMAMLLPLRATRYVYHVTPILILLSSVLLTTMARSVSKLSHVACAPPWCKRYCRASVACAVLVVVILASGRAIQTNELTAYATSAYRPDMIKFPHWENALRYVRMNMQEDDAVIALHPHIADLTMRKAKDHPVRENWSTDYWVESVMILQATLSDTSPVPRDRRAGAQMISDCESLDKIFQKHDRVWYVTIRHSHNNINHVDVSEYMRQHMDIVYEDVATVVMLRTNKHRPADIRQRDEEVSEQAQTWVLR